MHPEDQPKELGTDIDPTTGNFRTTEVAATPEAESVWADLERSFMDPEIVGSYKEVRVKKHGNIPLIPGTIVEYMAGGAKQIGTLVQSRKVPDPGFGTEAVLLVQALDGSQAEVRLGQAVLFDRIKNWPDATIAELPPELQNRLALSRTNEQGESQTFRVGQLVRVDGRFDGRIALVRPPNTLLIATQIQEYIRQDHKAWVQKLADPELREKYRYGLQRNREVLLAVRPNQLEPTDRSSNYMKLLVES